MSATQYTALIDAARRESEAAEQALAAQSAEFRAERGRAQAGVDARAGRVAARQRAGVVRSLRSDAARHTTADGAAAATRGSASSCAVVSRVRAAAGPAPCGRGGRGAARRSTGWSSQWRADIAAEAPRRRRRRRRRRGPRAPPCVSGSGIGSRRTCDAARVFIVPDGALSLVPFAALPVGERSFLLERGPVIHYLSAERDLVSSRIGIGAAGGPARRRWTVVQRPTLFAGPRPTAAPRRRPPPTAASPDAACAAAVPRLAARSASRRSSGTRRKSANCRASGMPMSTATWVRARACSSDAMPANRHSSGMRRAPRVASGHARILPERRLHGGADRHARRRRPVPPAARGARENPLLLSGLALAGANRRAAAGPDEDDGILTAEEVASLDLERRRVGGALGLRHRRGRDPRRRRRVRAAPRVPGGRRADRRDEPVVGGRSGDARVDAGALRRALPAELSTADAVHAGEPAVLRDRRAKGHSTHPFYWAAFVAAGDWR